jgi:hypothetical protein
MEPQTTEETKNPAEYFHYLIKRAKDAFDQITAEIEILSRLEAKIGQSLSDDDIASFVGEFSSLKRFSYEQNAAEIFVKSLVTSDTRREVAFLEAKARLEEFNKRLGEAISDLNEEDVQKSIENITHHDHVVEDLTL